MSSILHGYIMHAEKYSIPRTVTRENAVARASESQELQPSNQLAGRGHVLYRPFGGRMTCCHFGRTRAFATLDAQRNQVEGHSATDARKAEGPPRRVPSNAWLGVCFHGQSISLQMLSAALPCGLALASHVARNVPRDGR